MNSVSCKKKVWKLHSRQDAHLVWVGISTTKCLKIFKCLNQEKIIRLQKLFGLEWSIQTKRLESLLEVETLTRSMLLCSIESSMNSIRQIVVSDSKVWPCKKFWIVAHVISLEHSKMAQKDGTTWTNLLSNHAGSMQSETWRTSQLLLDWLKIVLKSLLIYKRKLLMGFKSKMRQKELNSIYIKSQVSTNKEKKVLMKWVSSLLKTNLTRP